MELVDFRIKLSIHPKSIHGAGGESKENSPICEGSKMDGV
jgi:hypothetical protein